jgi:hypothetical protein
VWTELNSPLEGWTATLDGVEKYVQKTLHLALRAPLNEGNLRRLKGRPYEKLEGLKAFATNINIIHN